MHRSISSAFVLSSMVAAVALTAVVPSVNAGVTPPPGTAFLNGWGTADNMLDVSISTSPTDVGTPWFNGASWGTTFSGSYNITQPGTYYIQVRAQDGGRPEMFIGHFALTGVGASFANGTQNLVSNTTDWVVSNTAFGVNTATPAFYGDNGAGPWGNFPLMGPEADFIWAPVYLDGVAYFTASFTVVPAPSAAVVLGFGGLVAARRRRA